MVAEKRKNLKELLANAKKMLHEHKDSMNEDFKRQLAREIKRGERVLADQQLNIDFPSLSKGWNQRLERLKGLESAVFMKDADVGQLVQDIKGKFESWTDKVWQMQMCRAMLKDNNDSKKGYFTIPAWGMYDIGGWF